MPRKCLLAFVLGLVVSVSLASDWPQFLGPTRNGIYAGSDVAESWPSKGPKVVWEKPVGHGFSGPVVAEQKLIMFQRVDDQEMVECLNAATGEPVWKFAYPTTYVDDFGFDDGPRAAPTITGGWIYTFGAEGMLHCLEAATGKRLWSVNAKHDFQAENGFFGLACSPLIEGDAVLLNLGGVKGAGIVAFDKHNGKLLWKSSDDEASYSSPVAATIAGQRYALFFTRNGFLAADPVSGAMRFQYPWHSRNRTSVNAATPLVFGDTIFLSACYGTGALLLRVSPQGVEKVWSGDDLLSTHYATSIAHNGFLYGIHGRADPGYNPRPKLRCVELKTRTVRWETDSIGAATLILAGQRLLILTDKGELVNAAASPDGFQPSSRAQVFSEQVRAFPALANGFFYARSKDKLACFDLRRQ